MSEGSRSLPPRGSFDRTESGLILLDDQPCSPKKWRYDIAVLCVVIVVVCGLLALPTIFYHRPRSSTDGICIPENYTGNVCREALQLQQSCLPNGSTTTDIITAMDPVSSQQDKEEQAKLFIANLDSSPECMEAVVPFLCFYIFPLCDSSGRLYQPSAAECTTVIDGICAREFESAATSAMSDQLPQCQLLPQNTLECNVTDLQIAVPNTSTGRVCSEGFYINESTGLCIPECGVWEEFPHSFVVGFDVVVILSGVINLLGSTAVLVLSCISYKRMFSFPSVFIVYNVIALLVVEVLLLIGFTDRTSLFCSSRDLLKSIEDETPFCTIHGLAFYYASLTLALFWFFHIVLLFWKIKFPFHAKRFKTKGYFRYVCVIMVIAAVFLPLESLIAILASGGLTIPRFPPVQCFPRNTDAAFYSVVFPISIVFAIAVSLIAIILWVVVTKVGSRQSRQSQRKRSVMSVSSTKSQKLLRNAISTTEVKVLIVFFYFFIFGVFSLTFFTILTSKDVTVFISELTMYFVCESQGVQPGRTCERNFNRMGDEIGMMVTYILLGFYPLVNLTYVVNFEEIKTFLKTLGHNSGYFTRTKSTKESNAE